MLKLPAKFMNSFDLSAKEAVAAGTRRIVPHAGKSSFERQA
jgi:hypothetical protein